MQHSKSQIRVYENGTVTITPFHHSRGCRDKKTMTDRGKKQKIWKMDSRTKRKIRCSAIRCFLQKKYTLKFITLTFSKPIKDEIANQCLSKFLENLKENYNLNSYVVVREYHKTGNSHFHCVFDIPFTYFSRVNLAWFRACRDHIGFSSCLVRTKKGKSCIVRNINDVSRYISKYISKADEETISRNYFIDHNTISRSTIIDENDYIWLTTKFKIHNIIIKDHFTIILLNDFNFLPEKVFRYHEKVKKRKTPPKNDLNDLQKLFDLPGKITAHYEEV